MSKGKAKSSLLGIQGVVGHKNAPDWGFLYVASTIKNPNYNIGDRVVLPDGRVFRYAKTITPVVSYHAVMANEAYVLKYTALAAAQVVGDKKITVPLTLRLKDDLRGGYVVIYPSGTSSIDNAMVRGIIGNDASGASNTTIYLDAPLTHAVTSSTDYADVYENPYREVSASGPAESAVVGVPTVTAATLNYIWIQTWGPTLISTGETVTAQEREMVFACGDGCLHSLDSSDEYRQRAGFILEYGGTMAGPLIMLQISP